MTYTLALDPGYKQSGIALFSDDRLIYAALIEIAPKDNLAAQWQAIAEATKDAINFRILDQYGVNVATEIMQVDGRTGRSQANALLQLQGVAGAVCGFVTTAESFGYKPSTWNKNRAKSGNHTRILRRLDKHERFDLVYHSEKITDGDKKSLMESLKPKIAGYDQLYERAADEKTGQAEHVLDAVGIGLYHLGRL